MMNNKSRERRPLRYRIDRLIRSAVMRVIGSLAPSDRPQTIASGGAIQRILLVRTNYRIGNAVLTLPAIQAFRARYPDAEIDFVGAPIARLLFENQSLNHFYDAPRRFPTVVWRFPWLMHRLRSRRYDLAVEVSCSQSGVGAFIVGLSGARLRAGCAGKWDRLLNLKIARLAAVNKYAKLIEFLTAMGIGNGPEVGVFKFTAGEAQSGRDKLATFVNGARGPRVGVFIGGRKLRGKRWPLEKFVAVIDGLQQSNCQVLTFLGPDEVDVADSLKSQLRAGSPIVSEPSIRKFAAIVAHLDLFVCCDSGPMHLACTVGVPVVAIFQRIDLSRWAPPASAARAVCSDGDTGAAQVLQAAMEELSRTGRSGAGDRALGLGSPAHAPLGAAGSKPT